ncbi:YwmB family TATA-box binding protein [Oceanobacillus sp. Castelsardo]|uniref:YwmB family TATA-box binding protein n=1 Tax=Oceanobacillus sp. Castelsardo TaxID=1851204 RepID=UPI000838AAA8|nr:YwmB family TATA-box binding protein [Oceanobacillus sp. Castelsardo]
MKRMLLISILFMITSVASVQGKGISEIEQLADFVTDQQLPVKEWQVITKEKLNGSSINKILNELKNSYKGSRIENENIIKFQFRDTHKGKSVNVTYNVILPKMKESYPELTVVIEGNTWNQEIKSEYQSVIHSILSKYFTSNKRIFSWLKTESGGIIHNGVFEKELMNFLNLQHTKTQLDTTTNIERKYIYGYTEKWDEKITIEEIPTNVQIAITQEKNGHTEVTLGTPILINEY